MGEGLRNSKLEKKHGIGFMMNIKIKIMSERTKKLLMLMQSLI